MHSKHNEDYTVHYNGDFSRVLCVDRKTQAQKEIPPALFALLYAAIADDIRGKQDDLFSDLIWHQAAMSVRNQAYWEKENE
jgi:hypothetical protein